MLGLVEKRGCGAARAESGCIGAVEWSGVMLELASGAGVEVNNFIRVWLRLQQAHCEKLEGTTTRSYETVLFMRLWPFDSASIYT